MVKLCWLLHKVVSFILKSIILYAENINFGHIATILTIFSHTLLQNIGLELG